MKRLLSLLLVFIMLISIFAVAPFSASASTSLPNSIYITQATTGNYGTCTLASVTMMLRSRAYLSGHSNWSSITESAVKSVAWGSSLKWSFTYTATGISISVARNPVSGISISSLKSLLNSHPEGIMLYCGNMPHAVFVTDYEGDTFYCADPDPGYSGSRRTLASSALGWKYGSQASVLSNATAYWYVSSYKITGHTHSYDTYLPDCPDCQVYAPNQNLGTVFYSTITNTYLGTAVTGVDGNDVKSYALNGSLKQWWKFENCGNNEYEITNCYYGKCLDVYCALNANNTNVDLYADNNTSAQRWYIKATKNGYILVSKCAPTLSVDIEATSGNDGANIQIYKCSANNAQVFTIPFRLNAQPCDLGDAFDSKIVNVASGKALTNKDGQLLMYGVDGSYSQAWRFVKDAEGAYQIFSYKNWGKCIDVYTGLSANHTAVQLYDYNTTNAQKWFVIKEDYRYRLVPRCSTSRTLDVVDGSSLDGASLQIYDYHKNNAQYFALDLNSLPFDILDYGNSFTSKIINEGTQKLVVGTSTGNVEIGSDNGTNESVWKFDKNDDGSYRVTNLEYNKCLDVDCGSQYNHTNIGIYAENETDAQKWYLVQAGDSVVFVPACALMRAMDVKDNSSVDGTNIELYTYWESSAQKYRFEMVKEEPEMLIGDVDGDKRISIMDATEIQRHIAQLTTIPEDRLPCADTNKDTRVSILDATQIQRFIAKLIPSL